MYWTPTLLILVVYAIVQYMARTKGDWDDRVKLREQARPPPRAREAAQARPRHLPGVSAR